MYSKADVKPLALRLAGSYLSGDMKPKAVVSAITSTQPRRKAILLALLVHQELARHDEFKAEGFIELMEHLTRGKAL